jgi:agmatine deiminase
MSAADPRSWERTGQAPSSLGYRMPAEWEPHERCIMGWPTELRIGSVWGEQYRLAMATYAAVAHAIAHFEPVLMLARPGEDAVARSYLGRDVEVVDVPIDDSWLRDSGPLFVTHPDGTLAMSDFVFNSWGEKYLPYDNDAAIGSHRAIPA